MRRRSTKHHPNIAEIVQSAQHLELLEVSILLVAVTCFGISDTLKDIGGYLQ